LKIALNLLKNKEKEKQGVKESWDNQYLLKGLKI
jgi:hypothetical protein